MNTERTYLRADLYRSGPEGPHLLGSQCNACGHVSVPPSRFCADCRGIDLAAIEVGDTATLVSETTVGMPSRWFAAGYRVGYVTLPTGTRLFTQLDPNEQLTPGQELHLELAPMWADETGSDVFAHRFVATKKEKGRA